MLAAIPKEAYSWEGLNNFLDLSLYVIYVWEWEQGGGQGGISASLGAFDPGKIFTALNAGHSCD